MDIIVIFAIIFGLLIGSFLNVVIYRLPVWLNNYWTRAARAHLGLEAIEQPTFNLITPPSRCGNCGARVKPWHNIPVISWLMLRGKCHSCHTSISIRYPLVELLTGVLFGLMAWQYGYSLETIGACVFTAYVVAMTFIDADTQMLPDELTLPLIWFGLLFNLYTGFVPLEQAVIGAMVGYMSLWTLFHVFKLLTGKEGMGYGDFKLLAAIGAWLGVAVIPITLLVASLVGIAAFLIKRVARNTPMAFGPCLAVAGWFVFLFHGSVGDFIHWWLMKSGF